MGGFPLGDMNWWPDMMDTWSAQRDAEWAQIFDWMENGLVPTANEVGTEVPSSYELGQNYPNPFNPTTRIEYSVPQAGNITLTVVNAVGQVVATLADGMSQVGNHAVTFDASDLPSGVYYYRLKSETGVTMSRKLVLIK